jgi:hypothetical protein
MRDVRYRADSGFEGKCEACREWWPIDPECWQVSRAAFRICRACVAEYGRLAQARRREDPEKRARDRAGVTDMRATLRKYGILGEYRHRWYLNRREDICAKRRASYAAQRAAEGKPYAPRAAA